MKKKVLLMIAFTLLTMAISLSACGRDAGEQLGIDGYVYVAEKIELPQFDEGIVNNIKVYDEALYFYNVGNLYRFSLDSGEAAEKGAESVLKTPIGKTLSDYVMDEENVIYYFMQSTVMQYTSVPGTNFSGYQLVGQGGTLFARFPDGSIKYQLSIPEAMISQARISNALVVNDLKQVFLLTDDSIYVIDEEGNLAANISTEEYQQDWREKENLFIGEEGKIYYCQEEFDSVLGAPKLVYEVIWDGTLRLNKLEELSAKERGSFFSSPYGLLYNGPDGYLYQYGTDDASVPLLTWSDSDLPNNAKEIFQMSDDRMVALWSGSDSWEGERVYLLTKTAVKELPEKEIIVLASVSPPESLQYIISDFNRGNDRYHITLKSYVYGEDGIMQLDASMVSSSPPDLLDMMDMDILKYAEKQGLEDLSPYLEKSTVLNKDDFLESVLESYTVKGRLVCIPSQFRLILLMGRVSQVGTEAGWTMEDVMDLTERFPDSRLMSARSFEYILRRVCSEYILEEYIDWETGECRFDSEEFRELMRWMEKNSRGISYNDARDDTYVYIGSIPSENLLLLYERIWRFMDYLYCDAMLEGEMSMIGFPTPDGRIRYQAEAIDSLGMVSRSSHKEGAWEFLEYFLLNTPLTYLSSRKDLLLQEAEEAMTIDYVRDENGELVMVQSEDGPVPDMYPKIGYDLNGEWYYVYGMTEEQVDTVLEAIDHMSFILNGGTREQIINIILEEMATYLKGDKTLEEATSIIQNRLTVLVNENL